MFDPCLTKNKFERKKRRSFAMESKILVGKCVVGGKKYSRSLVGSGSSLKHGRRKKGSVTGEEKVS